MSASSVCYGIVANFSGAFVAVAVISLSAVSDAQVRYLDDAGNPVWVDSIERVPPRFRDRATVLPGNDAQERPPDAVTNAPRRDERTAPPSRPPAPVPGQTKIGPAPSGSPEKIAAAAIKDAEHPCGRVVRATRLDIGGIRAVCSNGEAYRVFTVDGQVVAMRCSAAARLGVSGC